MIYFPCKHCVGEHASVQQMSRELWAEQRNTEVRDRCPKKQRHTSYRLRDTVWRETH